MDNGQFELVLKPKCGKSKGIYCFLLNKHHKNDLGDCMAFKSARDNAYGEDALVVKKDPCDNGTGMLYSQKNGRYLGEESNIGKG